jgi:hypothetical protein
MRHTTVDVSTAKPEEGSFELTTKLIRVRAYRFITRLKVFERLIKTTTTATDDKVEVCEWYYAYPFSEEPEPLRREQRVLATRSWHDPSKVTGRSREVL